MPDILLLHGAIGSKTQLEPLAQLLRDDFQVHMLNFSGHGGSPLPPLFSMPLFAADILKYVEAQSGKSFHVFGYSLGGYAALYLERHHPGTLRSIVTLATKFSWTSDIAEKESRLLDPGTIAQKIPAFAADLANRHAPQDWQEILQCTARMMIEMGNKPPLEEDDFSQLQVPTLLTLGDMDKMVSKEETVRVQNLLPNGFFKSYAGMPHPIEKIDLGVLAADIAAFCRS